MSGFAQQVIAARGELEALDEEYGKDKAYHARFHTLLARLETLTFFISLKPTDERRAIEKEIDDGCR